MKFLIIIAIAFVLLISSTFIQFSNLAYGQGTGTAGGVNVEGSWYLGEGLKEGDYFEYSLCEIDLNDCTPIELRMWIKGDIQHETETLWDVRVAIFDGNKVIKDSWGLGKISPEPVTFSNNLSQYATAFKSSIAWLGAFATGQEDDRIHGPQEFTSPAWGKIGAIGGAQLTPIREETITIPAGTFDTVVVGWYSGDWNEIWIVDDFPFPVKALTYTWITTGIPPIMYQFTLLDYKENVSSDPFSNVTSTEPEPTPDPTPDPSNDAEVSFLTTDKNTYQSSELITFSGFVDDLSDGQSVKVNLIIREPSGNILEPKGTFSDIITGDEFDFLLHTSMFNVDGIYSASAYIQSESSGKSTNFGFFADGTVPEPEPEPTPEPNKDTIPPEILIPTDMLLSINNPDGLNVEFTVKAIDNVDQIITPTCSPSSGSFFPIGETTVECTAIDSAGNTSDKSFTVTVELKDFDVPIWVKDVAGFWCSDEIDNGAFIQALQYLVSTEVIVIPATESGSSEENQDIPDWIKNNACWWSQGIITDGDFINAIQYLISKGIVSV